MIERVLPGVSVETVAGERAAQQGVTGVVAMPLTLPWGAKVTEPRRTPRGYPSATAGPTPRSSS